MSFPHTSSPLLQTMPQGNGSSSQMQSFTPSTSRMRRSAEIKRWETLRTFLNVPLAQFPHLLCTCGACRQWLGKGCIALPSKSLCGTLVTQKHDELPITCPGVTGEVEPLRYHLLLSKAWERHLGRRLRSSVPIGTELCLSKGR